MINDSRVMVNHEPFFNSYIHLINDSWVMVNHEPFIDGYIDNITYNGNTFDKWFMMYNESFIYIDYINIIDWTCWYVCTADKWFITYSVTDSLIHCFSWLVSWWRFSFNIMQCVELLWCMKEHTLYTDKDRLRERERHRERDRERESVCVRYYRAESLLEDD